MDTEIVKTYKYLGVHLNNKLDFTHNTDATVLYVLQRLYMMCSDSVVASAMFLGVVMLR